MIHKKGQGINYMRIEIDDDGSVATANKILRNLEKVCEFVLEAKANNASVLIHCSAGCSR
jgi:protein-tyrosine phosphatase